jgi:hypothetical protein
VEKFVRIAVIGQMWLLLYKYCSMAPQAFWGSFLFLLQEADDMMLLNDYNSAVKRNSIVQQSSENILHDNGLIPEAGTRIKVMTAMRVLTVKISTDNSRSYRQRRELKRV